MIRNHHHALCGLIAILATCLPGVARAELTAELQAQIRQAVLNGDDGAIASLASERPDLHVEIAHASLVAARDGLAVGAKLVLFASPESEAAAKEAGAVAPAAASRTTLAALSIAKAMAATSPADAFSLAQAAMDIATDKRVQMTAPEAVRAIAEAALSILQESGVMRAIAPEPRRALEQVIAGLLHQGRGRAKFGIDEPVFTSIDPQTISPSD